MEKDQAIQNTIIFLVADLKWVYPYKNFIQFTTAKNIFHK